MRKPSFRRDLRILSLLCTLPLLAGCFVYDTTVRLAPDGSGTVEQELVLTGGMASMLAIARTAEDEEVDLCAEQSLGEGVRMVSAEPIEEEERVGCRQVYAFTDVNTLRLRPDFDDALPGGLAPGGGAPGAPQEPITFAFEPGRPATLVVRMPSRAESDPDEEPAVVEVEAQEVVVEEAEVAEADARRGAAQDSVHRAMALAMMRGMLRGSRFSVRLVLPGEIVETNASYPGGDRITLVDLDFDALLQDPEHLERLSAAEDASEEEMRELMEEIPGMKVETRKEVVVRFR